MMAADLGLGGTRLENVTTDGNPPRSCLAKAILELADEVALDSLMVILMAKTKIDAPS